MEHAMLGLIEPPGPYHSPTELRAFLEKLKALPQDDPQVKALTRQAVADLQHSISLDSQVSKRKALANKK